MVELALKVRLIRRAMNKVVMDEVAVWPNGWPAPRAGDAIHLNREVGGFIEYVDWDLEAFELRCHLR